MRFLVAALLLVAGAATALATVALHSSGWGFIAWVTPSRPEGDYAISSDPLGFGLIALALVVFVYSVATLPRPRRGGPD